MLANRIRPDSPVWVPSQLRSILLRDIREGRFPPGIRLPSERRLAEDYGVSRGSVREALAALVNAGVLYRSGGKGTFVSSLPNLKDAHPDTYTIAFVISKSMLQFYRWRYTVVLATVEELCLQRGCRLAYHAIGEDPEAATLEALEGKAGAGLDGCIVAGTVKRQTVDRLLRLGVPVVIVDRPVPVGAPNMISVRVDYPAGTRTAIDHLHQLGHQAIGFIGFPDSRKYRAYWESLEALGLPYQPRWVVMLQRFDLQAGILAGYEATHEILGQRPLPSALLATDDLVALGAMEALGVAGIEVPGQMSLMSLDDLGQPATRPLTSIRVELGEVGRVAAECLLRMIQREQIPENPVVLPVEFVNRGSTGPPPECSGAPLSKGGPPGVPCARP
jgi:GntR family transcriptional regulator of arabinose operon